MSEEDNTVPSAASLPSSHLGVWATELRAGFLTASVVPVLLGTAIAWYRAGAFLWDVFLLTLVAAVCLHLGANTANDYFDHTPEGTGPDDINVDFIRPFSGGSRMIQLGLLSPRAVMSASVLFFAVGGGIGLYLAYTRGPLVLVLGVLGGGSGLFYSAPPLRFSGRGLGEGVVALDFGVLMTLGAYYVQALDITLEVLIASVPVAAAIASVLFINEFPDYRADRDGGKRTMVVILGPHRAAVLFPLLVLSPFALVVWAVFTALLPPATLIVLTTLPVALLGVLVCLSHHDSPARLVPANVAVVLWHLLTGIGLTVAYIISGLGPSPVYLGSVVIAYVVVVAGAVLRLVRIHRSLEVATTTPQV